MPRVLIGDSMQQFYSLDKEYIVKPTTFYHFNCKDGKQGNKKSERSSGKHKVCTNEQEF